MRTLATKGEVVTELRGLRQAMRLRGPVVKARDLALALYDGFNFTIDLQTVLVIDALVAIARGVVQEERARRRGHAYALAEEKERARETPEFPDFAEICRACPSNYALPGDDDPADTVYVETFDFDFAQLERGFRYLREHARAAERNAAALENLWLLCLRLRGKLGETPREILERHGYDPGED